MSAGILKKKKVNFGFAFYTFNKSYWIRTDFRLRSPPIFGATCHSPQSKNPGRNHKTMKYKPIRKACYTKLNKRTGSAHICPTGTTSFPLDSYGAPSYCDTHSSFCTDSELWKSDS